MSLLSRINELMKYNVFETPFDSRPSIDRTKLPMFVKGYIDMALYRCHTDSDGFFGHVRLSEIYSVDDLNEATMAQILRDCAYFASRHSSILKELTSEYQAGEDFWKARNCSGEFRASRLSWRSVLQKSAIGFAKVWLVESDGLLTYTWEDPDGFDFI